MSTRPCSRCREPFPPDRLYSAGQGRFVCTPCETAMKAERLRPQAPLTDPALIATVIRAHRWHARKQTCMCGFASVPTVGHADHVALTIVAACERAVTA